MTGLAAVAGAASAQAVPLDLSSFNGDLVSFTDESVVVNSTMITYDGEFTEGPLTSGTATGDLWFGRYTSVRLEFASPVVVSLRHQLDFPFSATDTDTFRVSVEGGRLNLRENDFGELADITGDGTSEMGFRYTGETGPDSTEIDRLNYPWHIESTAISAITIYYDGLVDGNKAALNLSVTTVPTPAGLALLATGGLIASRRRRD